MSTTCEDLSVLEQESAWPELQASLDRVPRLLADLRSPLPSRLHELSDTIRQLERAALELVEPLVRHRDRRYPHAATWRENASRHPQPDPTLLLAVREWVLSLASEPSVPLFRQKRLGSLLTEILVARASVLAYSTRLHIEPPVPLLHLLQALWMLVAVSWKLRPLLEEGGETSE